MSDDVTRRIEAAITDAFSGIVHEERSHIRAAIIGIALTKLPRAIASLIAEARASARREALEEAAPLVNFALKAGGILDEMAADGLAIDGHDDPCDVLGALIDAFSPNGGWTEASAAIRSLADKAGGRK